MSGRSRLELSALSLGLASYNISFCSKVRLVAIVCKVLYNKPPPRQLWTGLALIGASLVGAAGSVGQCGGWWSVYVMPQHWPYPQPYPPRRGLEGLFSN